MGRKITNFPRLDVESHWEYIQRMLDKANGRSKVRTCAIEDFANLADSMARSGVDEEYIYLINPKKYDIKDNELYKRGNNGRSGLSTMARIAFWDGGIYFLGASRERHFNGMIHKDGRLHTFGDGIPPELPD